MYDRGHYCACDPDPAGINLGNDSLIQDRSGAKASGTPVQPVSKAAGPASEGTAAAAPPGDCICRDRTTTLYLYTYDGRLVREYVNNAAQRDFLYAGSQRIGVYEKTGTSFTLHYFLTDHLGSTRSLVDATGLVKATYSYYPYGAARTSTVTVDTKHRYTGKELDDEDIRQYYYGARYLNGVTQCFNSVDPQAAKYPGWSPYCYALANPVRLLDRQGQDVTDGIAGFFDALASNVAIPGTYARRDYQRYPSAGRMDFLAGQVVGDAASMIGSFMGMAGSLGATGGSLVLVPASGGASLVVTGAAAASAAANGAITITAASHLGISLAAMKSEASSGGQQEGQKHHIATDKSDKSGYTDQLKAIFDKGGVSLQDKANKVFLEGHKGRHVPQYHKYVIGELRKVTEGLSGDEYAKALRGRLEILRNELQQNPRMVRGEGLP